MSAIIRSLGIASFFRVLSCFCIVPWLCVVYLCYRLPPVTPWPCFTRAVGMVAAIEVLFPLPDFIRREVVYPTRSRYFSHGSSSVLIPLQLCLVSSQPRLVLAKVRCVLLLELLRTGLADFFSVRACFCSGKAAVFSPILLCQCLCPCSSSRIANSFEF